MAQRALPRGARLARKRARRGARRIHTGEPLALVGTLTIVANVDAASAKDSFDLQGEVYQAYKIEMKNSASKPLKTVKAGTHRIKIEDKGTIHTFHLIGPGVNRSTSIPGRSETVSVVNLKPGTYTYFCDPHASTMRGSFRVTA
jgi:plastocyanin